MTRFICMFKKQYYDKLRDESLNRMLSSEIRQYMQKNVAILLCCVSCVSRVVFALKIYFATLQERGMATFCLRLRNIERTEFYRSIFECSAYDPCITVRIGKPRCRIWVNLKTIPDHNIIVGTLQWETTFMARKSVARRFQISLYQISDRFFEQPGSFTRC